MGLFDKFWLLIWKNLRLRRQKWIRCSLELAIPILMIYFLTQSEFNNRSKDIREAEIYKAKTEKDYLENFVYTNVGYAPSNKFTDDIMERVKEKIPGLKSDKVTIAAYKDEESMVVEHINDTYVIGIVFLDTEVNEGTRKLKYKIRDKDSGVYDTINLQPPYINGRNMYAFYYDMRNFVKLQLALDEAFIEYSTNTKRSDYPGLSIMEVPSPQYKIEQNFIINITKILPAFIALGYLMVIISVIANVVSEKQSGVKELMKIMGMHNWMIWMGWLLNILMSCIIINTVAAIFLKYKFSKKYDTQLSFLEYSDPSLIWILLTLYCIASTYMCFFISTIFNNAGIATTIGFVVWCCSMLITSWKDKILNNNLFYVITMLLPNGVLFLSSETIGNLELDGDGARWSNLFVRKTNNDTYIGCALLWLIADSFIFGLIKWYIECINPGKYGIAKPFYFIFQWAIPKKSNQPLEKVNQDERFFEPPSANQEIGMRLQNVQKNFKNVHAVKGVTLDIYKGEIMALLGHNGAGKTTTMSIITGMTYPSSGSIYFEGVNIFENMSYFRNSLGLCPQENLQFPFLTVWDHMLFFAMLKGYTKAQATVEAKELLSALEIYDKRASLCETLSGGMKRKLSLAISLIGNPKVLMLDEPTSGIDVQSRRSVWDLLLNMRSNRIVLLSTHYMEEADVLSDRIAIMHDGTVACYGTPMFLKKVFGTGYQLSIEQPHANNRLELKEIVEQHIPTSELKSETQSKIEISIPLNEAIHFPAMFSSLESSKEKLSIKTMSMACTTMQGVFFKVGDLLQKNESRDTIRVGDSNANFHAGSMVTGRRVTGIDLYLQQFIALSKKKIRCTLREWISLIFFSLMPIILGFLTILSCYALYTTITEIGEENPPLELSLSTYSAVQPVQVAINSLPNAPTLLKEAYVNHVKQMKGEIIELSSSNTTADLLSTANKDLKKYWKELITGMETGEKFNTILYNPIPYHSFPVTINLYTNALLNSISPNFNSSIVTINHPLKKTQNYVNCNSIQQYGPFLAVVWIVLFMGMVALSAYYTRLPCNEQNSGVYHIQIMCNLSPWYYWIINFIWDFIHYIIVVAFMILVLKLKDQYSIYTNAEELEVLCIIFTLYGISSILYAYVFSRFKESSSSAYTSFFILNSIIAIVIIIVFEIAKIFVHDGPIYKLLDILSSILNIIPPFALVSAISKFSTLSWNNNYCNLCDPQFNCTVKRLPYFIQKKTKELPTMDSSVDGILNETLYFIGGIVFYAFILILIDYHVFEKMKEIILNLIHKEDDNAPEIEEADVQAEKERVNEISGYRRALETEVTINGIQTLHRESVLLANTGKLNQSILLVVNNLMKNFLVKLKKFKAVKGVSFSVKHGECFGLLGVNGAGKSSTFKMLTADILPSSGDATIREISVSKRKKRYLSMVGYCPQFNSIIDQLTANEMLEMISQLRGIAKSDVYFHINKWISVLGLEEYRNRRCGTYSGGNKRKLCTAISLIGDPEVVFLDEPTSGVDPISRRKLYAVMEYSKKAGQAVVLTSHSMEECESLCDRLTIMGEGKMKCIGSIPYLKQQYAQGFTIMIRLSDTDDQDALENIKTQIPSQICGRFQGVCVLKDEHKGLLYYHVNNPNIALSSFFEAMEQMKNDLDLVEDYTLCNTTLEEVFLSFANTDS